MKPIAITMGEPAGIGIDLILSLYRDDPQSLAHCFLIADPDWCMARAKKRNIQLNLNLINEASLQQNFSNHGQLSLLPLARGVVDSECCGLPNPKHNQAVLSAIDQAIALAMNGDIAAMVTNPIHKAVLMDGNFAFTGHTDYLAAKAGVDFSIMLLTSERLTPPLRVIPLTVHNPLAQTIPILKKQDLFTQINLIHRTLSDLWQIRSPRLAFAGINPHAGEDGALGHEEHEILMPLIQALRQEGINISDPLPADSLFHEEARKHYDAVLCAYHDQALIPLKTLDFYGGVNVTLGLPFVRTSPDHGTALSLAGGEGGNPTSLTEAIKLARNLAKFL